MTAPKRVAINAFSTLRGGGQTYLLNLLKSVKEYPDIKIYVLTPPQFVDFYMLEEVEVIPCYFPARGVLHRTIWERWKLPKLLKELKADMVFCPGGIINFSPPSDCLTAVTFQNMLIFDVANRRKYPAGYMQLRFELLQRMTKETFAKADIIIFLSRYAEKKVDEAMPERRGLSVVIPHGLDDIFQTAMKRDVPRLESLPKEDYLLYVSVVNVFKAQIETVQAYHLLCQKRNTKEKLLLVGPEYRPYGKRVRKEIQRLGLENKVLMMGETPYADMPSVYHHAKAHIFASHCENCPNVVIESLGSGRPLFLSDRHPMPELGGDAAVYFDPDNPQQLADLLARHIDDEQWMLQMGQKAFERSLLYNWKTAAKNTFRVFQDMFERSGKP